MKKFFGDTLQPGELMQTAVPYGHRLMTQDEKLTAEDLVMTSGNPGEWKGPIKDSGLVGTTCKDVAAAFEVREVRACTPIIDKMVVEPRSKGAARTSGGVKKTSGTRPKRNNLNPHPPAPSQGLG